MTELTVHLRVNDAATLKPTPVRFCIYDAKNHFYAPLGRSVDFPLGRAEAVGGQVLIAGKRWFYIDGACEITLPTGVPLTVEISKGILYQPVLKTFTLGAGQMALRFAIEKKIEAIDQYFVDTHSHFLAPHDALLEAQAEGLSSIQLLIVEQLMPGQDGKLYPTAANFSAFSGQKPCLERDGSEVVVNTLNVHNALGKVALLNSHRPIFPLAFGEHSDDWSLSDWCDQCHRKKGFTIWVDALTEPVKGGEALINAILGKIDAIELDGSPVDAARLKLVYQLWNRGIGISIVGASGKSSNRTPLGTYRTGIHRLSESNEHWLHYLQSGWSYVTTAPVLIQDLAGAGSEGSCFSARAESLQEFGNLDAIYNGELLIRATAEFVDGIYRAELKVPDCAELPGWLSVRITGQNATFAHGNRIAVGVQKALKLSKSTSHYFRSLIEPVRDWVLTQGRYHHEKRKQKLLDLCDEALAKLETR